MDTSAWFSCVIGALVRTPRAVENGIAKRRQTISDRLIERSRHTAVRRNDVTVSVSTGALGDPLCWGVPMSSRSVALAR